MHKPMDKTEAERMHDSARITAVLSETIDAALAGAEREGVCQGCMLRSLLVSTLFTIVGNEPDSTDREITTMVGAMLVDVLMKRRAAAEEDGTMH